jgi:hypothetical protein
MEAKWGKVSEWGAGEAQGSRGVGTFGGIGGAWAALMGEGGTAVSGVCRRQMPEPCSGVHLHRPPDSPPIDCMSRPGGSAIHPWKCYLRVIKNYPALYTCHSPSKLYAPKLAIFAGSTWKRRRRLKNSVNKSGSCTGARHRKTCSCRMLTARATSFKSKLQKTLLLRVICLRRSRL